MSNGDGGRLQRLVADRSAYKSGYFAAAFYGPRKVFLAIETGLH
jgi:hypothetical protein